MARREGVGTVLDNTLVIGTSEHANGGAHDWRDHPFLFLGRAGGKFKAGQHLRGPLASDAPRVLLTAVRAVGVNAPKLGQNNRAATNPIGELLV
jgi:hypothetical protein